METILASPIENVASNIRKIREYKGYTQDYLAAKLKISQNAYSKLELGYSKLTVDRLFKISGILGLEAKLLISLDEHDLIKHIAENNSLA
ncbi:transcriptional regulator with XRE-family HTH domain [Pedobacter sp. UYP30]|uniref:helix-turn-helix domain-containing protein n=1 Tax=Pedobacter sp. UYP30 TaxID=1756400 RepID=UPI0033913CB0